MEKFRNVAKSEENIEVIADIPLCNMMPEASNICSSKVIHLATDPSGVEPIPFSWTTLPSWKHSTHSGVAFNNSQPNCYKHWNPLGSALQQRKDNASTKNVNRTYGTWFTTPHSILGLKPWATLSAVANATKWKIPGFLNYVAAINFGSPGL